MLNKTTTSILYIGKRKHRDHAKHLLSKGVRLGFTAKPDNSTNLFITKGTTNRNASHKSLLNIPCGLFMTDDAGMPIRLSRLVPVLVLVRNNNSKYTHLYFKGKIII